MRATILLATLLTLTACNQSADPSSEGEASGEPVPSEKPMPVEPDGGIGDGAAPLDQVLATRIPTRFHGVWDYVEGNCSPDSDLRMEISGSEILFYESIGMVTDVAEDGDDVVLTLAMEGEGETWEQKTRLSLVGKGDDQRLETSDGELPRAVDDYPNKRCPE